MRFLRRAFLGGLVLILPTAITVWVLWKLFTLVDQLLVPLFDRLLGFTVPGLGFITVLALVLLVGFFASSLLGLQLGKLWARIMQRLPLAGKVFTAVYQLLTIFQREDDFKGVVCFQYPREGIWSLGFVTHRSPDPIHGQVDAEGRPRAMLNIFVPTSPNPTSGFLLMVPADEVHHPPITVEEALTAATLNAAAALGRADTLGSVEEGKAADLVVLAEPTHLHLVYHYGVNLVRHVVKAGRVVVQEGRRVEA